MGSGSYSTQQYVNATATRAATGQKAFAHSQNAIQTGRYDIHELLDPQRKNNPPSAHAGQVMFESLATDEHPNPTSVQIFFDVTGSMGIVPQRLQEKLCLLLEVLLLRGICDDPQISMGAVGDAYTDRVPLQVAPFESDNRIDDHLRNIILEGNGGGQGSESYDLAFYFAARHTYLDSFERDGKKGFLIVIGDERGYPQVQRQQVERVIGDKLEANIPLEEILAEAQERYEVFFLIPTNTMYHGDNLTWWREKLGERAIPVDDHEAIAETIAMLIAAVEDPDNDISADLVDAGSTSSAVAVASAAVATFKGASTSGRKSVATVSGKGLVTGGADQDSVTRA